MDLLNYIVAEIEDITSRLTYNIFTSDHPKSSLSGKLFKFTGPGKIMLLKDKKTVEVSKEDLYFHGKKLYFPADAGP